MDSVAPVSSWIWLMTLPLGPITSPILSTGTRTVMMRGAGLGQRGCHHLGGDAVELGVQLEGGDELARAGDLEVHVTERVLGAEDVGQRDVLRLAVDHVGDEAHRDAGDGGLQ